MRIYRCFVPDIVAGICEILGSQEQALINAFKMSLSWRFATAIMLSVPRTIGMVLHDGSSAKITVNFGNYSRFTVKSQINIMNGWRVDGNTLVFSVLL